MVRASIWLSWSLVALSLVPCGDHAVRSHLLALVYVGGVVALQGLFRALTGQGSSLAVLASTLAIAALFSPLRRRVQGLVDSRFYRTKYDARRTLKDFSGRLRDATDLEQLNAELLSVVGATMQPIHVSLWLRPADRKVKR